MMLPLPLMLSLLIGSFALCFVLTGLLLPLMRRYKAIDIPNERSSHLRPVPRGGGWAMGITLIIAMVAIGSYAGPWDQTLWLLIGFAVLMSVSACDDSKAVSAKLRVLVQLAAVLCGLDALNFDYSNNQIFLPLWGDSLPNWFNNLALILSWMWFINLFNFMDGLDGLAASGAIIFCLAVLLLIALAGLVMPLPILLALAMIGVVAAFLCWNWHPAKLFMGDAGSVPLGYLLGFLLVSLAQAGLLYAAIAPTLYFVADTTITLMRRIARGETFWHPHREFFFHQAQQVLVRHDLVVRTVILTNIVLLLLAVLALYIGGYALIPAGIVAIRTCVYYNKIGKTSVTDESASGLRAVHPPG